MIAIYAEKPDMGTKIAAALFGIPLENGVVVTFSQLEKYERQIKAQRTKNGYFKIRYQGQEAYVTWGYGHMCTLKELPDIDIRYQNWKNIPLPYIPDHYELKLLGNNTKQYNVIKNIFNKANHIICATDSDREGDLIMDYLYRYMQCKFCHFAKEHKLIEPIRNLYENPVELLHNTLPSEMQNDFFYEYYSYQYSLNSGT